MFSVPLLPFQDATLTEIIDASSELDSIEQHIMIQQEQATEQAFVELQTLLNTLASSLSSQENSAEITEHFAALLLIILHNSLLASGNEEGSCAVDKATFAHKTPDSTDLSELTPHAQQPTTQQADNRPAEIILVSCATLASNLASIVAAPRNPIIVGQSIANSIVSLASIIKCALESRKKDKRNSYTSGTCTYTTLNKAIKNHFGPLLAANS